MQRDEDEFCDATYPNGLSCPHEAVPGRSQCLKHMRSASRSRNRQRVRESTKAFVPPAWLLDPSLLPKRPPGAK